jgi:hypothetical protein
MEEHRLDYATAPPLWHRRRWARRSLSLLIVLLVAPILIRLGRYSLGCLHVDSLFRQALAFSGPRVGYSEDIIESAKLVRQPDYKGVAGNRWPAAYEPPQWMELSAATGPPIISFATVYLHEHRTPSGPPVLVACDLTSATHGLIEAANATITVRTLTRGSVLSLPQRHFQDNLRLNLAKRDGLLRILWGKPDSNDRTHFTIDYTVAGRVGTIDGWVKDDYSVLLEPRGEPTSQPSSSPATSTAPAQPSPASSR